MICSIQITAWVKMDMSSAHSGGHLSVTNNTRRFIIRTVYETKKLDLSPAKCYKYDCFTLLMLLFHPVLLPLHICSK